MFVPKVTNRVIPNIFYQAAKELNLNVEILDHDSSSIKISDGKKSFEFIGDASSINTAEQVNLARNKHQSLQVLKGKGINVPQGIILKKGEFQVSEIENFLETYKKIVIKPNNGSSGKGVTAGIVSTDEINDALDYAFSFDDNVVVEEFVDGENYRVLGLNGEIIHIVKRFPAFVVGDGENTIDKLIVIKNQPRERLGINLIKADEHTVQFLKKQNLDLNSIPEKDTVIYLKTVSNYATGGETQEIKLENVPVESLEYLREILLKSDIAFNGVDIITPDIYDPFDKKKIYVNEINTSPGIIIHCLADMKFDLEVPKQILKNYFMIP